MKSGFNIAGRDKLVLITGGIMAKTPTLKGHSPEMSSTPKNPKIGIRTPFWQLIFIKWCNMWYVHVPLI